MFLEMIEPEVVDIYRTGVLKDNRKPVKIRVREKNAPGRLWFNMTFKSQEDAEKFVKSLVFELKKALPEE